MSIKDKKMLFIKVTVLRRYKDITVYSIHNRLYYLYYYEQIGGLFIFCPREAAVIFGEFEILLLELVVCQF